MSIPSPESQSFKTRRNYWRLGAASLIAFSVSALLPRALEEQAGSHQATTLPDGTTLMHNLYLYDGGVTIDSRSSIGLNCDVIALNNSNFIQQNSTSQPLDLYDASVGYHDSHHDNLVFAGEAVVENDPLLAGYNVLTNGWALIYNRQNDNYLLDQFWVQPTGQVNYPNMPGHGYTKLQLGDIEGTQVGIITKQELAGGVDYSNGQIELDLSYSPTHNPQIDIMASCAPATGQLA